MFTRHLKEYLKNLNFILDFSDTLKMLKTAKQSENKTNISTLTLYY